MQIEELIKKISFHDSSVVELFREDDKLRIKIDLCMWMQEGYKEGEDEIKDIILEFDKVTDYVWDSDKAESDIDYDTILELSYNDGILKIILLDEGISIISIVTFKSKNVTYFH